MPFRASSTTGNTTGNNVANPTITIPTTGSGGSVVAGDVAWILVEAADTGTLTPPAGWALAESQGATADSQPTGAVSIRRYWKVLVSGDIGATITFTGSGAQRRSLECVVFSAVNNTIPEATETPAGIGYSSSSSTRNNPSATLLGTRDVFIVAGNRSGTTTTSWTRPSGWTHATDAFNSGTGGATGSVAYKEAVAAGSIGGDTWTASNSTAGAVTMLVVVNPASTNATVTAVVATAAAAELAPVPAASSAVTAVATASSSAVLSPVITATSTIVSPRTTSTALAAPPAVSSNATTPAGAAPTATAATLAPTVSAGQTVTSPAPTAAAAARPPTLSSNGTVSAIAATSTAAMLPGNSLSSPTRVAQTSGTVTGTVATVTLPTYLTTDYLVLAIASNNANAQTFGSNVTATALGTTTNRLNLWRIVPVDGSQTSFTVTVGASSVLTWRCATYRGVNSSYTAAGVTNLGNSTTSTIEGQAATASWVATGNELVVSVGAVNSTATWTTTGSTAFNTTTGNAALMVNEDTWTAGALTAIASNMDRGNNASSRNESAATLVLSPSSDDATRVVNRLVNPSFEDAAGTSAGWETEETVVGTPAFTKVASGAIDGIRVQQMQYAGTTGDSGIFAIYQSPITATPGEELTFKVSVAGSKSNCTMIIGIEGFATGQVYISETDTVVSSLTGTMTEYSVTYTVPPTAVAVACYVQVNEVVPSTALTAQLDKAILSGVTPASTDATVTAVRPTASAAALPPAVTGVQNPTVTSVAATATAAVVAPTVAGTSNVAVNPAVALAPAAALSPSPSAGVTIAGVAATASATARPAVVSVDVELTPPQATSTAAARPPLVRIDATTLAAMATAQAGALLPSVAVLASAGPTPAARILVVRAEDRILAVASEDRTLTIPAQARTLEVAP